MTLTAFITHPAYLAHDAGSAHPESPARLHAIEDQLATDRLMDFLRYHTAVQADKAQLARVHHISYLDEIFNKELYEASVYLDPDTVMSAQTLPAALYAAGAVILAVDLVMEGKAPNAFCCVRPPGHHATSGRAMGFCLFNNIAAGAAHALEQYALSRIAICDFDVHHGNGTEDIFAEEERVLFCSSFQHPFYPYTPLRTDHPSILHTPLPAGADGQAFREAIERDWLPALHRFRPQMIFISAGFDGHFEDPLGQLALHSMDYAWVTTQLKDVAQQYASGRLISVLEGGYALSALGRSVSAHLKVLMGIG